MDPLDYTPFTEDQIRALKRERLTLRDQFAMAALTGLLQAVGPYVG